MALSQYMNEFAVKLALVCLMGDTFRNDKDVLEFRRLYGIVSNTNFRFLFLIFLIAYAYDFEIRKSVCVSMLNSRICFQKLQKKN